jgi:HTH-type transcriptional regulator/antitoxin HigA
MNIHPINNKKDYETAMKRIDFLMNAKKKSKEMDELEVLSVLAEKYEDEHFPIASPDQVEVIKLN